jgi:hypothetical protein
LFHLLRESSPTSDATSDRSTPLRDLRIDRYASSLRSLGKEADMGAAFSKSLR